MASHDVAEGADLGQTLRRERPERDASRVLLELRICLWTAKHHVNLVVAESEAITLLR